MDTHAEERIYINLQRHTCKDQDGAGWSRYRTHVRDALGPKQASVTLGICVGLEDDEAA